MYPPKNKHKTLGTFLRNNDVDCLRDSSIGRRQNVIIAPAVHAVVFIPELHSSIMLGGQGCHADIVFILIRLSSHAALDRAVAHASEPDAILMHIVLVSFGVIRGAATVTSGEGLGSLQDECKQRSKSRQTGSDDTNVKLDGVPDEV